MRLWCDHCKEAVEVESPRVEYEHHGEDDYERTEMWFCPYCDNEVYQEPQHCEICGDEIAPDEELCELCVDHIKVMIDDFSNYSHAGEVGRKKLLAGLAIFLNMEDY